MTERGEEAYRLLGLINGYQLQEAYHRAHPDEPMPPRIRYRPQDTGRAYQPAAWQVMIPGTKTDPDGYWRDYGEKTFIIGGRTDRDSRLAEAITWTNERYGTTEWAKIPKLRVGGDYAPKHVVDWFLDQLKAARKAAES
jgi:hypothetical protein